MTCQHCGREHPAGTVACPLTGESHSSPGLVGARLDRYQVERLLGAGGFGAVYRARHVHTDSAVALKLLKKALCTDGAMVERFLREAKAAAAVGSEHIVRITDAGQAADGTAFLAMELLEGWDLKELAAREGPLSETRLVLLTLQVLEGLSAAHQKGIVHRDMKPANVFVVRKLDERGVEKDYVKLLDFGISKMHAQDEQSGQGLTLTGVAMGTPSYMAPEQFFDARNVDGRADLYSVSVMLYELLAGKLPFDAQSYAELVVKVRTEAPRPLGMVAPKVSGGLAQVVMTGLAREKEKRWTSAQELGAALRQAVGLPAMGQTSPSLGTTRPPSLASAGPAALDTPSMMLGQTVTPRPPSRPSAPTAPLAVTPVAVPAAGTPSTLPLPPAATPVGAAGPSLGGGGPGPAPVAAMGAAPPPRPAAAAKGSRTWLWVVGILGALALSCCTCTGVLGVIDQQNRASSGP